MGGKSKSSQATTNNQHTTNHVNDGEFAGASNVSVDESETDISDSNNTDNSVDTEIDISDSNNTDNSVDTEIEDSFNVTNEFDVDEDYDYSTEISDSNNTDNSTAVDGDGYFANGNITLVDAGAVEAAKEISQAALQEATKQNAAANALSSSAIASNERSTRNALDANERAVGRAFNSMEFAIDEVSDIAATSVEEVGATSTKVIGELTAASSIFADNLKSATEMNFAANEKVLINAATSNTEDKAVIAELAKSTSLAGQDIVAESSQKMTMYMAIAVAIGFVAMLFMNRGK